MGLSNLKHVSFFDEMVFPYMEKLTLISSKHLIGLLINMRATLKNDGITDDNILSMSIGYCRGLKDDFRIRYIIFQYANALGDVISIPYNFETIIQKLLEEITYSYIRVNYPINNLTGIPSIEYLIHTVEHIEIRVTSHVPTFYNAVNA